MLSSAQKQKDNCITSTKQKVVVPLSYLFLEKAHQLTSAKILAFEI